MLLVEGKDLVRRVIRGGIIHDDGDDWEGSFLGDESFQCIRYVCFMVECEASGTDGKLCRVCHYLEKVGQQVIGTNSFLFDNRAKACG